MYMYVCQKEGEEAATVTVIDWKTCTQQTMKAELVLLIINVIAGTLNVVEMTAGHHQSPMIGTPHALFAMNYRQVHGIALRTLIDSFICSLLSNILQ